ncbi:MAG: hypothetical protein GY745_01335 [Actinomycetia bacterium]|nr:hypothetical protein [Actinomycetes bacterium]
MATPRPFLGYEESRNTPNIVVDGSPNEATVLTLTHGPGQWQPEGTQVESGATTWTAQPPSSLTPLLRSERDSSLDLEVVLAAVGGHLRTAPTAWDPFPS